MRLSQSSCFKAVYEKNNEQLLSQSALSLTFYEQKITENAMFRNFGPSTDKIYQWDFPEVAF